MQVLSLRHSRPAKSGYEAFSMGITPYGARKAQKMPKQAKSKGEVKPTERGKNKARGRKALDAEAGAAVAEAQAEVGVGNAMAVTGAVCSANVTKQKPDDAFHIFTLPSSPPVQMYCESGE